MFRFTIRELILLTIIVAMGAAWWLDHSVLVAVHNRSLRTLTISLQRAYEAENPAKGTPITIFVDGAAVDPNEQP